MRPGERWTSAAPPEGGVLTAWARTAVRSLERFVLPNSCVCCGQATGARDPDALVCEVCRSRLKPVEPGCRRCQQPLPPVGPCRFCAAWPPEFLRCRSGVWMGPEARELIHHLKYEGYTRLVEVMAAVLRRFVEKPVEGGLVPVPLGARRLHDRGFNQAEVLARGLAREWNLPLSPAVVRRSRETRTQTALTPERRWANLAGAFEAVPPPAACRERGVIVIDDVLTTGATVAAVATALGRAGWRPIVAMTFARAVPYDIRASG